MSKHRIGILLLIMGSVFLAAGLFLLGYNAWESDRAGEAAQSALEAIKQTEASELTIPPAEQPAEITEATEVTEPAGPSEPEQLEIFELEGDDYIGWITAPAYDRELPVMHQIQEDRLKKAPCLETGSPITDDAVISGHNYKSHFLFLHTIQPGETVYFTHLNGFRVEYEVTDCLLVDPTDLDAVLSSVHDLVLYTCTSDGENRWAVYCDRTKS